MRTLLLLPLLAACDGGGGTTDDTDSKTEDTDTSGTSGTTSRTFADFVNSTETYSAADPSCVGAAAQVPDPSCQVTHTLSGQVLDFQNETGVADASVKFWYGDDITQTADVNATGDEDGFFSVEVPSCTPVGYGTTTPYGETVDTYEVHQIYDFESSRSLDESVNSVSQSTASIIPSIIGITWDDTSTGIIAGAAYDCSEDAIGHVQVYLHDGAGNPPARTDYNIFYFDSNDFPTKRENQNDTNPDNGLWVAMNVPEGTWTAEMWGWDGSDYVNLAATQLTIKTGSVNISNLYLGHDDGIFYPASCLSPCE